MGNVRGGTGPVSAKAPWKSTTETQRTQRKCTREGVPLPGRRADHPDRGTLSRVPFLCVLCVSVVDSAVPSHSTTCPPREDFGQGGLPVAWDAACFPRVAAP